ncbi:MAG: hypothetical protein JJU33_04675 [Phycisphaerales bacterium]|nr:hypothetical protein [Phycisphaerales bacterium]
MSNPRPPRRSLRTARCVLCVLAASAGAVLVGAAVLQNLAPTGQDRWLTPVAFDPQREDPGDEERRECIVTFRDGTTVRGELVHRDNAEVVLRIRGVSTTYPATRVRSIQFLDPIMERYREMRAAIDDYEVDQLVVLIDWLTANGAHTTALEEAEALLRRVPGQPEVIQRLPLLRAQARLAESRREERHREREDENDRPTNRRDRNGFPLLSSEQINLLKVYEIDLADPPRIRIKRETVKRLIENYSDARGMPTTPEALQALYRTRPERVLELMFRVQARDLYAEVEVVGDPEAFQRFRRDVHAAWLFRGCATNDCHGGQEAGRLMLRGQHPNRDETVYTNFFIVENFRFEDGEPLIDYEQPEQSRLLQLALPRETSKFPHPRIIELDRERPWRPLLRSPEDPRFRDSVRWINSMYRPRPDYPITYELPKPEHDLYTPPDEPPGPR